VYLLLYKITQCTLNRVGCIDTLAICVFIDVCTGLSLGGFGAEDEVVAGEDHLQKLSIVQAPILINVKILDHELAVILTEVCPLVFCKEVGYISRVNYIVSIPIYSYKRRISLEISHACKGLAFLFDGEFAVGNCQEEVFQLELRIWTQHFLL